MDIPVNEQENVLSVLWDLLKEVEGKAPKNDTYLRNILVPQAYDLLNKINYTQSRPRWEDA